MTDMSTGEYGILMQTLMRSQEYINKNKPGSDLGKELQQAVNILKSKPERKPTQQPTGGSVRITGADCQKVKGLFEMFSLK